jgi:hypothetical protein
VNRSAPDKVDGDTFECCFIAKYSAVSLWHFMQQQQSLHVHNGHQQSPTVKTAAVEAWHDMECNRCMRAQ